MWVKTENGEVLNTLQHASKCNPYLLYDTVLLNYLHFFTVNRTPKEHEPSLTLHLTASQIILNKLSDKMPISSSPVLVLRFPQKPTDCACTTVFLRESHESHKSSTVQHHRQWSTLITAMPEERTKWSSNYRRYCNKSWVKVWVSTVYNYRVIQYRVNASRIL